jgi:hypothetical protein
LFLFYKYETPILLIDESNHKEGVNINLPNNIKKEITGWAEKEYSKEEIEDDNCCDEVNIYSYFEDETIFSDVELKKLIFSLKNSIIDNPNLVYSYLDMYVSTQDDGVSEFLINIVSSGDEIILNDFLIDLLSSDNQEYVIKGLILSQSIKPRDEFYHDVMEVYREWENSAVRLVAVNLIDNEFENKDVVIHELLIPSVYSQDDEVAQSAMIKLVRISEDIETLAVLFEISNDDYNDRNKMAKLALSYYDSMKLINNY